MNKKIEIAKKEVKRILKKEKVEFAYIYGSSLTKKDSYDIDILFIIKDDEFKEEKIKIIEKEKKEVYSKYKDLLIHIQPLQPMSRWWKLILKGEPWIIDSLKNPLILKDSKNILKNIVNLIKKQFIFEKSETEDYLLERSVNYLVEVKNELLGTLIDLSEAATEAFEIFLVFHDKVILNKKKIIDEIEKKHKQEIRPDIIDFYKELIDLEEKMLKGSLTEFTAENLEYYQIKVEKIINEIEEIIISKP